MDIQFAKHIFTNLLSLQDYLVPDQHGIGVKREDVAKKSPAMSKVHNNSDFPTRVGQIAQNGG